MQKAWKKTVFALLCAILAIACVAPCLFADAEVVCDFSRRGNAPKIVSAVDFLQNGLQLELTEGEIAYLNAHSDFEIRYSDNIPSSVVTTDFDEETYKVTVTPKAYRYTANNQRQVTWEPTSVNDVALNDGFATVLAGNDDFVTVHYRATLDIDKDAINALLNSYYYAGKAQSDRFKDYNKAVADYERYINVLLPAYQQYCAEYAQWALKDAPYQQYLAEYRQYLAELEAYNTYDPVKMMEKYTEEKDRYEQYLSDLARYNELYAQYLEALQDPDAVRFYNHLEILEYMYALCDGRNLRNAIMGGTVTQVLANKDLLKTASKEAKAVDKADSATRNLRDLISKYEQQTSDEAKYIFYRQNYDSLKENFTALLRCLDYFYRVGFIHDFIHDKGKDRAYEILLAQLFEIVNALDNGTVGNYEKQYKFRDPNEGYFDDNYRIDGKTPQSILGDCLIEDTNDALPLQNGFQLPVEPTKPTEVTEPKYPERPQLPLPPEEVPSPGPAPQVVECPAPVAEPAPYTPTQEETALREAFDRGIELRKEHTDDFCFQVEANIKKYFRNYDSVTVYFHVSENIDSECYPVDGERGTYIEYPADLELPSKHVDGYTCLFDGWVYPDGEEVDWNNLREGTELHLLPKFQQTPNLYDVIWVIDGVEYKQQTPFGEIPQFEGDVIKQDDADGRKYRFVEWSPMPVEMTQQTVRYTAQFEASAVITWKVGDTSTVTAVWKGDMPVYPDGTPALEPNSRYAFIFEKWDVTPVVATADATYTAVFKQTAVLTSSNDIPAKITRTDGYYTAEFSVGKDPTDITLLFEIANRYNCGVVLSTNKYVLTFSYADVQQAIDSNVRKYDFYSAQTESMSYAYKLTLLGDEGEVDCPISPRVTVTGNFLPSNTKLLRIDGDASVSVRVTLQDNKAEFAITPNTRYELRPLFNVYIAKSSAEMLSADMYQDIKRYTTVHLTLGDIPVGKNFEEIYYVDSNGNTVTVENNSFVMPNSDVTLFVRLSDIYYTVTFCSEGEVLLKQTYRYGEEVKLPDWTPTKSPDGEYSYTFAGWDNNATTVTGDAVYNAIYTSSPLEEIGSDTGTFTKLVIALSVVGGVVVVGVVALTVLLVRKKRRSRAKH